MVGSNIVGKLENNVDKSVLDDIFNCLLSLSISMFKYWTKKTSPSMTGHKYTTEQSMET